MFRSQLQLYIRVRHKLFWDDFIVIHNVYFLLGRTTHIRERLVWAHWGESETGRCEATVRDSFPNGREDVNFTEEPPHGGPGNGAICFGVPCVLVCHN